MGVIAMKGIIVTMDDAKSEEKDKIRDRLPMLGSPDSPHTTSLAIMSSSDGVSPDDALVHKSRGDDSAPEDDEGDVILLKDEDDSENSPASEVMVIDVASGAVPDSNRDEDDDEEGPLRQDYDGDDDGSGGNDGDDDSDRDDGGDGDDDGAHTKHSLDEPKDSLEEERDPSLSAASEKESLVDDAPDQEDSNLDEHADASSSPPSDETPSESHDEDDGGEEPNVRDLGHPIWALGSISVDGDTYLVSAGGGGLLKSGIANQITLFRHTMDDSHPDGTLKLVDKFSTKDAPKNLDFFAQDGLVAVGIGNECHVLSVSSSGIRFVCRFRTDFLEDDELTNQKCVSFSPCGGKIATGGTDGCIRVWTVDGDPIMSMENAHGSDEMSYPTSLAWSPDGDQLVSSGTDCMICIWDIGGSSEGKKSKTLEYKGMNIRACFFSPTGETLYTAQTTRKASTSYISRWSMPQGRLERTSACFSKMEESTTAFNISPDGKYLAAGSGAGHVAIFQADTLHCIRRLRKVHGWITTKVCFSPDEASLFSSSAGYTVRSDAVVDERSTSMKLFHLFGAKGVMLLLCIFVLLLARMMATT